MDENKQKKNNKKVLVVEDDQMLRDLLTRKLDAEGFAVKLGLDAKEAFSILDKEKPDIILLDLILPGIDGFEILSKLKADDNFSGIPVLILSNLGQQEDIDRAMSLGAAGFMIKANYTLNEIVARINKVLEDA